VAAPGRRAAGYPRHWEADVVASDGGVVHLRPITPKDADKLREFHGRLSERTRYLRFFGPYPQVPDADLKRFVEVDHHDSVAFVGVLGDDIVAVGRYFRLGAVPAAEVAFVVRDDHQGRGLGSILLEHLAAAARENGIERFEAEVLVENHKMIRVFRDAGYQVRRELGQGTLHLVFDVDPTERSLAVRDAREQAAEARSVHNVLHPRSVAVIGASTDQSKIGHAVLANLLRANFTGPVFPVNPEARSVRGVRAYPSVTEIPDEVDLAVVAVPAAGVDEVMDSCLAKGVKALVVLSSGFADVGGAGAEAQRRLVTEARAHGMRVIGPNALGVVNTAADVSLNATLAPEPPAHGRIGFFCQSGALGVAILAGTRGLGLGLSTFVSAGNRADLSGNDMLQYWQTDPATDVVLLYLETFGNPRKFARLARRLARRKPVVAVKSGRFTSGPDGVSTRGVPVDETSVQALFEQAGVIRVQTLAQLFDTALLLAFQPLPAGPRVAVVGNSTALGLLVTDALRDEGLIPAGPPVDVGASASPTRFADAVAAAAHAEDTDALVAVFVPPIATPGAEYARALRMVAAGSAKPVLSTFLAVEGVPAELAVRGADGRPTRGSVPSYSSPERAVAALARVLRHARWREEPPGVYVRPPGIRRQAAREMLVDRPPGELDDPAAARLLACFGIEVSPFRLVGSAQEAREAVRALGAPVAVKGVGRRWQRPDLVGIRLDVGSEDAAEQAYHDLVEVTGEPGLYVQRMAAKGPSCVLEVIDDPSFGAVLSFGLSGIATELLDDRAFHVVPLSTADAERLVRAPRAAPLLTGWGGGEPADLGALEELALRVSCLVEDLPEVRTLRLDPVLAAPDRASVTAAWVTVGQAPVRDDDGPRRMR
jgi:acyl-CoA synthetase (NDP forming)/GNAT superfamily N-acetyltransferase